MSQEIIKKVQEKYGSHENRPEIQVGDTIVVHNIIRDGDKKRIQKFQGMVISIKGSGADKMFTVRKISYGVGVEKIFPINSTNIDKIEVLKHAKVSKSKLYYMRKRIGKAAMKLKAGDAVVPAENSEMSEEASAEAQSSE